MSEEGQLNYAGKLATGHREVASWDPLTMRPTAEDFLKELQAWYKKETGETLRVSTCVLHDGTDHLWCLSPFQCGLEIELEGIGLGGQGGGGCGWPGAKGLRGLGREVGEGGRVAKGGMATGLKFTSHIMMTSR